MATFISPGVYTREIDLSTYVPQIATTITGMVGLAKKGPVNVPTFCANMNQFIEKFGQPDDDYPYAGLAAEQYFLWGNQLQFVRVVPMDEDGYVGAKHSRLNDWMLNCNGVTTEKDSDGNWVYRIYDNVPNMRWDFDFEQDDTWDDLRLTTTFMKQREALGSLTIPASGSVFTASDVLKIMLGSHSDTVGSIDNRVADTLTITFTPSGLMTQSEILAAITTAIDANANFKDKIVATYELDSYTTLAIRIKLVSTYDIYIIQDGTVVTEGAVGDKFGFTLAEAGTGGTWDTDPRQTTYVGVWTTADIISNINDMQGNEKGHLTMSFVNGNYFRFNSFARFRVFNVVGNCDAIHQVVDTVSGDQAVNSETGSTSDGTAKVWGMSSKFNVSESFQVSAFANTMTVKITAADATITYHKFVIPAANYGTYNAEAICRALNDTRLFDTASTTNWALTGAASGGKPNVTFFNKGGYIVVVANDASDTTIEIGAYISTTAYDTLGSILGYQSAFDGNTGLILTTTFGTILGYVWFPVVRYAGEYGNDLRVRIWYSDQTGCNISVDEWDTAYQDWEEVERYDKVVFNTAEKDTEYTLISEIDSPRLMLSQTENMINETDPLTIYGASTNYPQPGTYYFTGGNDGDFSNADSIIDEMVGSPEIDRVTKWPTGMYIFSNPERIDINTLVVPYYSQYPEVWSKMAAICESRNECIGIVDTPEGLDVEQVRDWSNGSYGDNETSINSSYLAIYWPWLKYYDQYSNKIRMLPPSGFVAGQYAYNDQTANVYHAPAGFNRGRLINALGVEYELSERGDRDYLYGPGDCINCIVDFIRDGVTIFGQKTTQRKPSALDRVNVRRGLNYMKKSMATLSKYYTFEPNDQFLWTQIRANLGKWLLQQKARRALYTFEVRCDEETNTDINIDQYICRTIIFLQFVKAAEIILLDATLLRTGGAAVVEAVTF